MTNKERAEDFRKWCLANGVEFGIRGSQPFLTVLEEHFREATKDLERRIKLDSEHAHRLETR